VNLLLGLGKADMDLKDKDGLTLLCLWARDNGRDAIVKLLVDKGADVNAQGGEYGNALQAASYEGHEAVVRLLLDKGANVNAQGGGYSNGLQAASCRGHEAVVRLLVDKGADVNAQGGEYGNAL
jgi:ankyrin repeat protein